MHRACAKTNSSVVATIFVRKENLKKQVFDTARKNSPLLETNPMVCGKAQLQI